MTPTEQEAYDERVRLLHVAEERVAELERERDRYRDGMANWKATAEVKDTEYATLYERAHMLEHKVSAAEAKLREGVVVPREPTEAMLSAARYWSLAKFGKPVGNDGAKGCWTAMLSAAEREA